MKKKNVCPICGYKFKNCQCRYGGSCHPNRDDNLAVVQDHLYMLSIRQIIHLIKLQKYWSLCYGRRSKQVLLSNLKDFGSTEY